VRRGNPPNSRPATGDSDEEAADLALAREAEAVLAEGGPTVTLAELLAELRHAPGCSRAPIARAMSARASAP
jgi:hypothetical protein